MVKHIKGKEGATVQAGEGEEGTHFPAIFLIISGPFDYRMRAIIYLFVLNFFYIPTDEFSGKAMIIVDNCYLRVMETNSQCFHSIRASTSNLINVQM